MVGEYSPGLNNIQQYSTIAIYSFPMRRLSRAGPGKCLAFPKTLKPSVSVLATPLQHVYSAHHPHNCNAWEKCWHCACIELHLNYRIYVLKAKNSGIKQ
jgi:hypothetical protein